MEHGQITAKGPVSGVHVHHHMVYGPQALPVQLDLRVVIEVMFMLGEKARQGAEDEPLTVTPASVMKRLQELGVVSGNGKVVGRDAVYESFARLREKGYLRRIEPRERGKRVGPVSYEFYEWPTWNPDWTPEPSTEDTQVNATSGNTGSGNAGSRKQKRTKTRSAQVNATSGNTGSGIAGSGTLEEVFPQVGATSGNAVPPPHPPEEEVKPPPPPTPSSTKGSLPSQREEAEAEFSSEETTAAARFLQGMERWQPGAATARKCAPRLLRAMREQGWPTLADMADAQRALLETEILKNTDRAKSWTRCLPGWVEDLRLYGKVSHAAGGSGESHGAGGREMCPEHPRRYRKGCLECAMAVPDD
ncbi:pentapeptide repeat-containing protein [Streptomyces sp. JJ66]|uniref:pentapeptide repeat-containing protein n=1 Tax=Streptomyces sp. JJ66 TaxID=2803843 RepID=UPI0027E33F15|nr:pentapeptide repeat-containing protein [Streptomyces sp. JJ66]